MKIDRNKASEAGIHLYDAMQLAHLLSDRDRHVSHLRHKLSDALLDLRAAGIPVPRQPKMPVGDSEAALPAAVPAELCGGLQLAAAAFNTASTAINEALVSAQRGSLNTGALQAAIDSLARCRSLLTNVMGDDQANLDE